MYSTEHEFYFSFSNPFLDFPHASDCIQYGGGLLDFSSRGFFSGSVLDTVSEDPIAEFEDSGDILSTLASSGMPFEAPLPSETNETVAFSSSSIVSEDHNFDLLQSPLSSNKPGGFCTPSLTMKEVLKEEVESGYMGVNTDGITNTHAISSVSGGSSTVLTSSIGTLMTADALNPGIARQCSSSFDGLVCEDKQSLSSLSSSSMSSNAITVANMQLDAAESIYTPGTSLELTSSNTPDLFLMTNNSGMVYSLDEPNNHHHHDTDVDDGRDNGSKALPSCTFLFRNPETSVTKSQDFSAEGMESQSKAHSPLFETVKVPQTRTIQRSLSSHALGQLHNCNIAAECTTELQWFTQTASQCSPSNVFGLMPAHSQFQLTSSPTTCTTTPICSMRRVCSTGDIQTVNLHEAAKSPPFAVPDERSLKIGRYTLEERKNRICRYRQKRTERNFSKKIKYACRKTLADSRPRVRGRFARNDDMDDVPFYSGGPRSQDIEDEACWQLQRLSRCCLHQ